MQLVPMVRDAPRQIFLGGAASTFSIGGAFALMRIAGG